MTSAHAAPQPLAILDDVSYSYTAADAAPALSHVRLEIARGEYVALLGHNGSGKSTLARLLSGLLLPTSGRVLVDGVATSTAAAREHLRARVGMIFSDPDNQIIATVVEDDVAWGLAARSLAPGQIAERVEAALAATGLREARRRAPHELSGGQRQRLAIAAVLALRPTCIIADEPTALLDPRARLEVNALLRGLHREQGLTVVHVTHLLEEAAQADRVVVLEGGRVALEGTPATIFADLERLRALRLVVPQVAWLGERLRALGLTLPASALTPDALVTGLVAAPAKERGG